MTTHLDAKETTFYEQLQNCPNLDLLVTSLFSRQLPILVLG
jgi:hypothetical protein